MISKKEFVKTMNELEELEKKMNAADEAIKELDPEFCGLYISSIFNTTINLLKYIFDDESHGDWIDYFIYEKNWLRDFHIGDITDKGEEIEIYNWADVYDFLIDNMKSKE